jgi:ABC-type uncharacterized transport system fused permease/ATPase subunit
VQELFAMLVFLAFSMKTNWFVTLYVTAYVLITLPIIQRVSRPILPATYGWRAKEGDLRFAHARQREYCEAVAFYGGQEEERCVVVGGGAAKVLCCGPCVGKCKCK